MTTISKRYQLICEVLMSILIISIVFAASPIAAMNKQELQLLDVSQRREIMRNIAIDQPENASNDILPILEAGLSDPDVEVRKYAAAALGRIALATMSAKAHGKPIVTNLDSLPSLRNLLFRSFDDNDEEVRSLAIETFRLTYGVTPELCDYLIQQFSKEKSSKLRSGIVRILVEADCNSDAMQYILISALQDTDPEVRGWAAKGAEKFKPQKALPLLINGLNSPDPFVRNNCVAALAAYGNDAKPYLSNLEKLAASESNETVKITLQQAIEQIRGTK